MNAAMPALPSVWPMFPLTEPSRHGSPRARLVDVAECVGLDHVAENRSGAVCFDETDLSGLDLCEAERAAHQLHLGPTVRGGDPVAAAVVVRDRTLHDGVDRLAAATASSSRRSTTAATPSPRPMPSAHCPNGLQRPSGAESPAWV